jgi:adenine-specific DNA-methyltransferase
MKKLDPEKDGASLDIVNENLERLYDLFPEVFTEGGIDFDALREVLGDNIDDKQERYTFSWHGKSRARHIAQTPSTGTLLPCLEESTEWDSTRNIFIEGDNLEVLKLLQKSYHRQVKMIYIDPPYNTGKEFIYPDKYQENLSTYLKYTGQTDAEGFKLSPNAETSGRYHTNWLNMMYPRLRLARNLLRDDGVIVVSIDDNESYNLRHLLNEIFGEENFIASLVWEKSRKNDAKFFSVGHEYALVYAKSQYVLREENVKWREAKPGAAEIHAEYLKLRKVHGSDYASVESALRQWYKDLPSGHASKKLSRYKNVDSNGVWRDRDISWPSPGGPKYPVLHPKTGKPCKVPPNGWRFSTPKSMQAQIDEGLVVFREDHNAPPFRKAYLTGMDSDDIEDQTAGLQVMPSVLYKQAQVASKYIRRLFGRDVFDNPKDHEVLARWISYCTKPNDIVLDFFAGSGSTADAVLRLNAIDGGSRRCILVQLPEPIEDPEYKTIADITKARWRLAAQDILRDSKTQVHATKSCDATFDTGFKAFKLASSNIKTWDAEFNSLEKSLFDAVENIKTDRTQEDVLCELLLKYGLDLAIPVETRTIENKKVFLIGAGALVVCLDTDLTLDTIEGIAALKGELNPEVMRVVFRDIGFSDDVVKTNSVQILRQAGIDDVKSL